MVPVLDSNKKSLMPCSEKRARLLMIRGQAVAYWQKGIFCIRLTKEPSARKYQAVALGIDPGSKREGYTVATKKSVVLNITTNTPDWVKDHVETRRMLRRARRYRKTPNRQMRENRSTLRNSSRTPPSTKARWQAKLRIIKQLRKILPITIVNVEDIKASIKKGKVKWNRSFSPLEHGKTWFYSEVEKLGIQLVKTRGFTTKQHRDKRGFPKTKAKLEYTWTAHNVDSHSLAEMALATKVRPHYGLYQINFLEYYRRQLHIQQPQRNNIRKQYGTTVSLGMSRGSVVRYSKYLAYIGGYSEKGISLHYMDTGIRRTRTAKPTKMKILYVNKYITKYNYAHISSTFKKLDLDK